jgi:hypothetical protein
MVWYDDDMPQDEVPNYKAVDATMLCGGCAFWKRGCRNEEVNCCPSDRKDKRLVIFIKEDHE